VQVFRGFPAAAADHVALTIGNFDGVHRGHQAMLARLVEAGADLNLPAAVLIFEPQPREFFAREAAPARLSTLRDKLEVFAALGVERVYVARFNAALAGLAAQRFIDEVLVRSLGTRWVLVGADFRFGSGRGGDLALLRAAAHTFSVEAMPTISVDGERASSSAVREALAHGELARATRLLGHPYAIAGRVAHGHKRGRSLGFPTANVALRRKPAVSGIFAVWVHGVADAPRAAVASLGVRPTVVSDGKPLLEVFVFDFDEAIYGQRVRVEFLHKLRDEQRYADLDALKRQIHADVAQARDYFATQK
jgi:riboflavin kinase/FMN adenylyltransferase